MSMMRELIADVIFTVNIVFKFLTAPTDGPHQVHLCPLFLDYARGTLLLDVASTIPPLITGESH
jgi:hypothetical protein